jgi:hypothetical protein
MKNLIILLSLATGALAFMPSQADAAVVRSTVSVEHHHRVHHRVWHHRHHHHVVVVHRRVRHLHDG